MSRKSKKIGYTDSVLNRSESINSLTWSEWSDIELNAEPWDYPKGGKFSDPQEIVMPRSLRVIEWKRFEELNCVNSPILYEAISGYPDFITNNEHLMHSEFIRCFISTMINLQYCGRNGLEIENSTSNFSWNLGDQCWHGWFNVYSMNKAGKGVLHHPVYNPNGRYVVRMFYMGCWRRILIDDLIPIDKIGRPMLPRTSNVNELWPMILAKAMLKVAALSWTEKREMVDCSLITCLTGWICLSLNVSHLSPRDQWEFLIKYAKHFEWPKNENSPDDQAKSDVPEKSTKSRKSKNKVEKIHIPEEPQPTLIFLSLDDTINVNDEGIPGITPCWNHEIYVELSRDVPLDPTQVKRPLAKWKNHRWLEWSIRRGLADASEYFLPLRHLLVVSPLRQCTANISYNYEDIEDFEKKSDSSKLTLITSDEKPEKKQIPETTESSRREKIEDSPEMPDISTWEDFNKISYYLQYVHLFYRQKFFDHSFIVSNSVNNMSLNNNGEKNRSDSSSKDKVKKSLTKFTEIPITARKEKRNSNDKILQSSNEPIYLFVDSIDDKIFLVNFSTENHDNPDEPVAKKFSSMLIERYDFFERLIDDSTIGVIKTRGTKSLIFQLEPGRHLLKIFINFVKSYRIIVLSDTSFEIGNLAKMHDLMIEEAQRIRIIAQGISNSLEMAFESFGSSSYALELKNYYRSYMPDSSNIKLNDSQCRVIKSIHRWFADEFFKLVEKHFSSIDLPIVRRAMRIFFLDPKIGMKTTMTNFRNDQENENNWENYEDENENNWENYEDEFQPNEQATIVQSFFRMSRIKRYKEIHDINHLEHYSVKDTLRRIIEIFDYERQQYGANYLLRKIIKRDKCLMTLYKWSNDLKHVIEIQEIIGHVTNNMTSNGWIPIVRTRVNTEISEIVIACVDLFVENFSNYIVKIFDNDTKQEITSFVNNSMANCYSYRKNGYTIFAYGRCNLQNYKEQQQWSLHLTTIKGEPLFHWNNEKQLINEKINVKPLFIREISNIYVPNSKNSIFKIIVKIKKSTLVSLRLTTSYDKVLTKLRVIKENNEIIEELEGGEILMMPIIFLESDATSETGIVSGEKIDESKKSLSRKNTNSSSNRSLVSYSNGDLTEIPVNEKFAKYKIEAFVRKDSWPLTLDEWKIVMELKDQDFTEIVKSVKSSMTSGRKSERSRNFSKKTLEFRELTKPHWCLQIITDMENDLEIIRDNGNKDKIAEFRKIWNIEETGSNERGRELRDNFIEENSRTNDEKIEENIEIADSLNNEISTLTKRTHVPPINFLPKLDLTIYMVKDDEEENRWIKTDYDEETLRNQRAMNILDFEHHQTLLLEESSGFLEKQRDRYRQTAQRYLENRHKRVNDMNETYEMRQAYVDNINNTVRSSVKSMNSTKTKKER